MFSENAKKERIYVSFEIDEKITLDHMENFSRRIFDNSVQRGILIYKGILTKKAEEVLLFKMCLLKLKCKNYKKKLKDY